MICALFCQPVLIHSYLCVHRDLIAKDRPKIQWVEASSKDFAWIGRSQFPGRLSISTSCNCGINGGNICVNWVTLFCISSLDHDEKIGDYFGQPQWNWAPWRLSKILPMKMWPSCNFSSHVFRVSHNHSMWIHKKDNSSNNSISTRVSIWHYLQ